MKVQEFVVGDRVKRIERGSAGLFGDVQKVHQKVNYPQLVTVKWFDRVGVSKTEHRLSATRLRRLTEYERMKDLR